MAKTIKPEDLGAAIAQELTTYHQDVIKRVNQCSDEAVKALVKKTKATAPKKSGAFRRSIAGKLLSEGNRGNKYVWYVKAPHYRLTHLLVHGHEKVGGGRVKGDPFLKDALDEVLPAYEKAVTEAVSND
jgi:hypothetical protein